MSFGWSGAAAGASDALQKLLAERLEQQYRAAVLAGQEAARAQDAAQFDANLEMQNRQLQRQIDADKADEAYRQRQEDVAATERRQTQNQRGVRSLILEGMRAKTTDPRTAQLMAAGEGVDIPMDVLDPEKEQRDRLAQIEAQGRQNRLTAQAREAGGPPEQQWVIRNGQTVPIPKGTAQPGDQPYDAVANRQGAKADLASLYSAVRGSRAIDTVDELLADTGFLTTGPLGVLQGTLMPGTPGYNYRAKLDSLGSQIAQQELAQMREASKTGGAVGQVSNFEQMMFMNALAPIVQGQSPAAMREGLQKARASLSRYRTAIMMKNEGVDDAAILSALYPEGMERVDQPSASDGSPNAGSGSGRGSGAGPRRAIRYDMNGNLIGQ